MRGLKPVLFSSTACLLSLLFSAQPADAALTLSYCSSQNTADTSPNFWTWQSNGWCFDKCKGDYALAIVQENNCWCSNYLPADQTDTSNCNKGCPGYPDEKCGSDDGKLFGYISLNKKPSGTKGASQPTATDVSSTSVIRSSSVVRSTSTPPVAPPTSIPVTKETTTTEPATVVTTVTESPSVITLAPGSSSKSTGSSGSSTAEPTRYITVTGAGGGTTIITVVPTAPSSAHRTSSNVGAIVGGVIGGLVGLAAIVGAIFFFLWRRRKQQREAEAGEMGVHRHTSTMSKHGLIRSSEKEPAYSPEIATNIRRSSRMMPDTDSISPAGSDRRSSRPYIFDQRLNPSAIMMQDNASRASFVSMDDSRDYGRTLNVRNPDPDPDPDK